MNIHISPVEILGPAEAEPVVGDLANALRAGAVIPVLGPSVLEDTRPAFPTTPEALAEFFSTKVAMPRRAKGNCWASAQHIESFKLRATVTAFMAEAFAAPAEPTALHRYLASLPLPMIVDVWYDSTMRNALSARSDWGEVQGISRAGIGEDRWYRFYDASGSESDRVAAEQWTTLLYKPHGGIAPARNFLISDADYVEVLTEIDIQTPIPDIVKDRRQGRSFLFLGCRFNDQLLRTYARQVTKPSTDRHFALVDPERLTRNELKFFHTYGITPLALSLQRTVEILMSP